MSLNSKNIDISQFFKLKSLLIAMICTILTISTAWILIRHDSSPINISRMIKLYHELKQYPSSIYAKQAQAATYQSQLLQVDKELEDELKYQNDFSLNRIFSTDSNALIRYMDISAINNNITIISTDINVESGTTDVLNGSNIGQAPKVLTMKAVGQYDSFINFFKSMYTREILTLNKLDLKSKFDSLEVEFSFRLSNGQNYATDSSNNNSISNSNLTSKTLNENINPDHEEGKK